MSAPRLSPNAPPARSRRRYLRDRHVQYAALVTALVMLLSAGLVWLGYLVHVWRVARRSPLQPPRRMTVLVFGRRLEHGLPGSDYRLRLRRVLALARQQCAEQVLLLGGHSGRGDGDSEAAAGNRWLRRHDWPSGLAIQLEQESVDTLENLRHARHLLLAQTPAALPAVALVSSRYHLARCQLLARRLGFTVVPVSAEPTLPWRPRYLGLLLMEATYLMWIDVGLRWADLIGHRHMQARVS